MKKFGVIILLTASLNTFAGDIVCANKEARDYGAKILNAQLLQHGYEAVHGDEFLAQKVIVAEEIMKVQPLLTTVGDLQAVISNTKESKKLEDLGWAVLWTFYKNLPKQATAETLLTDIFCQ